jgi:glycerol dehydrogenase
VQLVLEGQPQALIEEVLGFAARVGLPMCLEQIGLRETDAGVLERVAARATAAGETIHNEPFPVDSSMVIDAMRAADAIGRQFRARV